MKIILGCNPSGARYCMTYKKECFILCREDLGKVILGCVLVILGCKKVILGCNPFILGCGRIKTKSPETLVNKGFAALFRRRRFVIIDNQWIIN